jgi:hypothetical protein
MNNMRRKVLEAEFTKAKECGKIMARKDRKGSRIPAA